jgi:hypothetical protein
MKTTQAWGWLAAGVVALGLNGFYHDGGAEWMRRMADQVAHSSAVVLALASGRAGTFLTEAQLLTMHDETRSLPSAPLPKATVRPWTRTMARLQTGAAKAQADFARFEVISARHQARLMKLKRGKACMEAESASRAARSRARDVTVDFEPASFDSATRSWCPRIHLRIPEPREVHVQVPETHVETVSLGTAE